MSTFSPEAPGIQRVMLVAISKAMGGMESVCIDLSREYVKQGVAVTLVVPPGHAFDEFEARGTAVGATVRRHALDRREGILSHLLGILGFVRTMRSSQFNAIHVHTGGTRGGIVAAIAVRLFRPRTTLVLTEHEVPPLSPSRLRCVSKRFLDRLCHCTTGISRRNTTIRTERFGWRPRHLAAIINGTPVEAPPDEQWQQDRDQVRQSLDIPDRAPVVGSVVRFSPDKNVDNIIEAVALLRACPEPAHLLLVGDGALRHDLEALTSDLGIAERVHFVGHQANPLRFLPAMDIFTLAVSAGSGSIALLEAMSFGIPGVITFCGPEEAVRDRKTGLCARPNDPADLSRAYQQLIDDPCRRLAIGKCAQCFQRKQFSSRRVANDYLELYSSLKRGTVPERLVP